MGEVAGELNGPNFLFFGTLGSISRVDSSTRLGGLRARSLPDLIDKRGRDRDLA